MFNNLRFLLVMLCISVGTSAFAAGYCLSPAEIRSKSQLMSLKAMNMASSNSTNLEAAEKMLDDATAFQESIFPNCLQYFKTTSAPDCQKMTSLATGYMLLDKSKQPAAKAQALNAAAKFSNVCKYQYQTLQMMLK